MSYLFTCVIKLLFSQNTFRRIPNILMLNWCLLEMSNSSLLATRSHIGPVVFMPHAASIILVHLQIIVNKASVFWKTILLLTAVGRSRFDFKLLLLTILTVILFELFLMFENLINLQV